MHFVETVLYNGHVVYPPALYPATFLPTYVATKFGVLGYTRAVGVSVEKPRYLHTLYSETSLSLSSNN